LRASLKVLSSEAECLIEATGIKPTARAEEIDIEGFVRLANAFPPPSD
ncbi:MAG: 16S rRNA (adenine(1518)-N(6)/adenine(1519)-N(6))-dimethyltransferase, partial [Pseudomonadota bacterium]